MNLPFDWLNERTDTAPLSVALGVFDGVHRGHQALLASSVALARDTNATPAALTFDPHPTALFAPARVPPILGTLIERAELLTKYGMEQVIVARFDKPFAAMTPEEFVTEVLVRQLRTQAVVVGEDFRFGCDRTGDANYLHVCGNRFGFQVAVVQPVFVDGVPARSTAIRQMLVGGKVAEAARLLGRPYTLSGVVVQGRQLGRTIGFPTANVASEPGILVPGAGIYAGLVERFGGSLYRAAISVGTNPTVTDAGVTTVEPYLLDDFNEDLYGETLRVHFLHYLRGMERFGSLDRLTDQMHRDVARAKELVPVPT